MVIAGDVDGMFLTVVICMGLIQNKWEAIQFGKSNKLRNLYLYIYLETLKENKKKKRKGGGPP